MGDRVSVGSPGAWPSTLKDADAMVWLNTLRLWALRHLSPFQAVSKQSFLFFQPWTLPHFYFLGFPQAVLFLA